MFSEAIRVEYDAQQVPALDALNAIPFTPAQIKAALDCVAALPADMRDDGAAGAQALEARARDAGQAGNVLAAAALHARVGALTEWTATHDPDRQSDAEAVLASAARFPLSQGPGGVGFEPGGFQEMVLFFEELPW